MTAAALFRVTFHEERNLGGRAIKYIEPAKLHQGWRVELTDDAVILVMPLEKSAAVIGDDTAAAVERDANKIDARQCAIVEVIPRSLCQLSYVAEVRDGEIDLDGAYCSPSPRLRKKWNPPLPVMSEPEVPGDPLASSGMDVLEALKGTRSTGHGYQVPQVAPPPQAPRPPTRRHIPPGGKAPAPPPPPSVIVLDDGPEQAGEVAP